MLNEKELSMARELASELVVVQEKKTMKNAIQALKTIHEALTDLFYEIKNTVSEIWGTVKNTEVMTYDIKKRDFYNWHVPIKVNLPDAPFVKNHKLQFARSSI